MEFGDDLFDAFGDDTSTTDLPPNKRQKKVESDKQDDDMEGETKTEKDNNDNGDSDGDDDEGAEVKKKKSVLNSNEEFAAFQEQEVRPGVRIGSCSTEICYPPNWDFDAPLYQPPPGRKPAKTYPFVLDEFQKQAISSIEHNESVLVSAHTSAGKTVNAEYAIATSLRDGQRVIYTSPIKALSNQKYRELYEEFGDVGLMTGDITINPTAGCLVMTTEILRNMLYKGSEVMREVKWVVFDEVHYMSNKSRGVVWEETLILLPHNVKYVFLSATIPNSTEFALWIAKLHNGPCKVVYTDYRPTPLQHYCYPSGGEGLYLVVDEKGNFRDENFDKAIKSLGVDVVESNKTDSSSASGPKKKKWSKKKGSQGPSDIFKIVKMIMERQYYPAIVFSFSKRDVESHAVKMAELDFSSPEEKKLTEEIFNNAIDALSDDDKKLPQVHNILPLLMRGIGLHHGGLLPILKEVIEILFQESLLKVLFATETFAMGLNMPAKTVVYTAMHKWDGVNFRLLSSGEYTQMSGRAGRRGLDARGIVMLMMDEEVEATSCKQMIKGSSDALNSSFYLGYNMLLNLLRVENADPEYMLARCFWQFQAQRKVPALKEKLEETSSQRDAIRAELTNEVTTYYTHTKQLEECGERKRQIINTPIHLLAYLNPGRLVEIETNGQNWGWGLIINFQKKRIPSNTIQPTSSSASSISTTSSSASKNKKQINDKTGEEIETYVVDILLYVVSELDAKTKREVPAPATTDNPGELKLVPVLMSTIKQLSKLRLYLPKEVRSKQSRKELAKKLKEAHKRMKGNFPCLHPVEDLKIKDPEFKKLLVKTEALETKIEEHPLHDSDDLQTLLGKQEQRLQLETQIVDCKAEIKKATQPLVLRKNLKGMKRVLRRLGHIHAVEDVMELKGRVACEISTGDELLATELIFGGCLTDLTPAQLVALSSCLVCDEKCDDPPSLPDELAIPLRELQENAKRIGNVMLDCRLELELEEYINGFQPMMMEVVFAWCGGAKFADICKMTDIFEGSIIRVMRRLEELLRQMEVAAGVIGNADLKVKFAEGRKLLKRDIVFCASLYL